MKRMKQGLFIGLVFSLVFSLISPSLFQDGSVLAKEVEASSETAFPPKQTYESVLDSGETPYSSESPEASINGATEQETTEESDAALEQKIRDEAAEEETKHSKKKTTDKMVRATGAVNSVGVPEFENITHSSATVKGNFTVPLNDIKNGYLYHQHGSLETGSYELGPASISGGNRWTKVDLTLTGTENGGTYQCEIQDLEENTYYPYTVIVVFVLKNGKNILRAGKSDTESVEWQYSSNLKSSAGTMRGGYTCFFVAKDKVGEPNILRIRDTTAEIMGNYEIDNSRIDKAYAYYRGEISTNSMTLGPQTIPGSNMGGTAVWHRVDLTLDKTGSGGTYAGEITGLTPNRTYSAVVIFVLKNGKNIIRAGITGYESVDYTYSTNSPLMYFDETSGRINQIKGEYVPKFTTKEVAVAAPDVSQVSTSTALVTGSYSGLRKEGGQATLYYQTGLDKINSTLLLSGLWTKVNLTLTGNENGGNYSTRLTGLTPGKTYSVVVVIEFESGKVLRSGKADTESVPAWGGGQLKDSTGPTLGKNIPNFTTKKGTIGDIGFSDITSTSATLSGSYEYDKGSIKESYAYYKPRSSVPSGYSNLVPKDVSGGNDWTRVDLKLSQSDYGGTYHGKLQGLEANETYWVMVLFITKDGMEFVRVGSNFETSAGMYYNRPMGGNQDDLFQFTTGATYFSNYTFSDISETSGTVSGSYTIFGNNDVDNGCAYYQPKQSLPYFVKGPSSISGGNGWTKADLELSQSGDGGTYTGKLTGLTKNTEYSVIVIFTLKNGTTIIRATNETDSQREWIYDSSLLRKDRTRIEVEDIPFFTTEKTAQVSMTLTPPSVTTTFYSAKISGKYEGVPAGKSFVVKYKKEKDTTWESKTFTVDKNPDGEYSKVIDGLSKDTLYHYYVAVMDGSNERITSPVAMFRTDSFSVETKMITTYRSNTQIDLELGYVGGSSVIKNATLSYRKKGDSTWINRSMNVKEGKLTFSSNEFNLATTYQVKATITTKDDQVIEVAPDEMFTYDVTVYAPLVSYASRNSASLIVAFNGFIGDRAVVAAKTHTRKRQVGGGGAWTTTTQEKIPDAADGRFTFTMKNLEEYTLYETYATVYFANGEKKDSPIRMFSTVQLYYNLLAFHMAPEAFNFGTVLERSSKIREYGLSETSKEFSTAIFQDTRLVLTGWQVKVGLSELEGTKGDKLTGSYLEFDGELRNDEGDPMNKGFHGEALGKRRIYSGSSETLVKSDSSPDSEGLFVYWIEPESVRLVVPRYLTLQGQQYTGQVEWVLESLP